MKPAEVLLRCAAAGVLFLLCGFLHAGEPAAAVPLQDRPEGKSAPFKRKEVPISFRGSDGMPSLLSVALPFAKGELFGTRQLLLINDQGAEIPMQSAVPESWEDGSCRWVLLRALVMIPGHGPQTAKACFGADVLRKSMPGIVTGQTKERMRIETSPAFTAELDLHKFSLPDKMFFNGKALPAVTAPAGIFPAGPARVLAEEEGPSLLTLRISSQDAPATVLRLRFSYGMPGFELEYASADSEKREIAAQWLGLPPETMIFRRRFVYDRRTERFQSASPIRVRHAVVPPEYLVATGAFADWNPPAEAAMREFENNVLRTLSPDAAPRLLLAGFFRTGRMEYGEWAMRQLDKSPAPPDAETRHLAFLYSGEARFAPPPPPSEAQIRERGLDALRTVSAMRQTGTGSIATEELVTRLETLRAAMERFPETPVWRSAYLESAAFLAHAFAKETLLWHWHAQIDRSGAVSGTLTDPTVAERAARQLLHAANINGDAALAAPALNILKRRMAETTELTPDLHHAFCEASAWLQTHPPVNGFHCERAQTMLLAAAENGQRTLALEFSGDREFSIVPQSKKVQLSVTRRSNLFADSPLRCIFGDAPDGRELPLRRTTDGELQGNGTFTAEPGKKAAFRISDGGRGEWRLKLDGGKWSFPLDDCGVTLKDAQFRRFTFFLPDDAPEQFSLRFQGLDAPGTLLVIFPDGKGTFLTTRPAAGSFASPSLPLTRQRGEWSIVVHAVSGGAFLAADGVRLRLTAEP